MNVLIDYTSFMVWKIFVYLKVLFIKNCERKKLGFVKYMNKLWTKIITTGRDVKILKMITRFVSTDEVYGIRIIIWEICMSCVFYEFTVIYLMRANKTYLKLQEVKVKCVNSLKWKWNWEWWRTTILCIRDGK